MVTTSPAPATESIAESNPLRAQRLGRLVRVLCRYPSPELFDRRAATVQVVRDRQLDHLSKRQLALILNLSPTIVNRYAADQIDPYEVRFGVISRLSELLGSSLSDLVLYFETGRLGLPTPSAGTGEVESQARPSTATMLHFSETLAEQFRDLGGWSAVRKSLLHLMTTGFGDTDGRRQRVLWSRAIEALLRDDALPQDPAFWAAFLPALQTTVGQGSLGSWSEILPQLGIQV
jgi:hypothetical protein